MQIRKILLIGVPNGIENGLFQAGKIILASLVASFGTSAITVNAICQTVANIQVIPGSVMQLDLPVILKWYHLSQATAELTSQMVFVQTAGAVLIWSLTFVLPASMWAAGDVRFAMIISIVSMWIFHWGGIFVCRNA